MDSQNTEILNDQNTKILVVFRLNYWGYRVTKTKGTRAARQDETYNKTACTQTLSRMRTFTMNNK